jgi:hypothetical protein
MRENLLLKPFENVKKEINPVTLTFQIIQFI